MCHCLCALIPRIETKTRVMFLQHPRERDVPIGTARMTHLALVGSKLVEGIHVEGHPDVMAALASPDTALLFPDENAKPIEEWSASPPSTLIVVDGTWWQAKKLLKMNPRIAALPKVSFKPAAPGNYRIRKEPSDEHLATIEAVAGVLGTLEGDAEKFQQLLVPFTHMVDRQIEFASTGGGRHKRCSPRRRPSAALTELLAIRDEPERAVIMYGEANCQDRQERVPGDPEILHLVASRPETQERFEAVFRERRPLGEHVPDRIRLSRQRIVDGELVSAALERFRGFLKPRTILCAWGPFTRDLLVNEGEPSRGFVDLRALSARALRRSAGGIDRCTQDLCAQYVDEAAVLPGRAGRMLTRLERILPALIARLE